MSKKNDKKMRQLFRRDIRADLKKLTEMHFQDGPVFNTKPKRCPLWFWNWCVKLVVDDGFLLRYRMFKKAEAERAAELGLNEDDHATS